MLERRTSGSRRFTAALIAFALFAAQVVLPPAASAAPLGSTTASAGSAPPPAATLIESFQPDLFTGRATSSIPIMVPPGRRGLQPNLALRYASSGRNGWLGVGWSLDLGAIERSTKLGVPTYTSADTLVLRLGGISMELVAVPGGFYKAKDEGLFLRIQNLGASGWEVRDKSGTQYLFGGLPDTEETTPSGTFRWCLRRIVSPSGNYLAITYTPNLGQLYPLQVQYTGHGPSGLLPANTVDFVWEDSRPDIETSSRSGIAITTAKRLQEITVKAANQLVRTYQLGYSQSARTGRSLLTSVTQVGTDGVSALPPISFTYQASAAPTYTFLSNTGLSGSNIWNVRFANKDWTDINGAPLYPSQIKSWGETSATFTQGAGSFPGFTWSTDNQGNIQAGADRDMNLYLWTYVFVASPTSPSFTFSQTEDSQLRFFVNGDLVSYSGFSISLPLQQGWNLIEITSYNQNAGFSWNLNWPLASQVDIMNPTQFIQPALSGDFNGDGLTDLCLFDQPSGTWSVSPSIGSSFGVGSSWLTPFGSTSTAPVLGDWNGDGKVDIATYNAGSWQFAKSTGASFARQSSWDFLFGGGTPLTGDFNGDGKTDLATYNGGSWSVALWNGNGFSSTGSFALSWGSSSHEPLTGDFNGDGLTDIGTVTASGDISVALSNGTSFAVQSPAWRTGFGSGQAHIIADFNGDGLSDAAYYDRAAGQVPYAPSSGTAFGTPQTVGATFGTQDPEANDQTQVADFNGDGLADPAVFDPITGAGELAFSTGQMSDLLTQMTNSLGGSAAFTYVSSGLLDNTGGDGLPDLPFIVPIVNATTFGDGMGNSYTTTYAYQNGRFDVSSREFRGFSTVTVSDLDGHKSTAVFHQDDQTKGRLQQLTRADKDNNLYSEQANTWLCTAPDPGVSFCSLSRSTSTTFDGDATSKQAAVSYEYDSQLGNVTRITEEGDAGLSGDERITEVSYTLNTTDWLVNRPSTITVFEGNGTTKRREQRFYYDLHAGLTDTPTEGKLTKVEEWLDTTSSYPAATLGYDSFGNVTSITDAANRTTLLGYDTVNHALLVSVTNALNHTQTFQRHPRFGVVTSVTDANVVSTATEYDVFGRPFKVVGPNDTSALPTLEFVYELSTVPGTPSKVTLKTREQSGPQAPLTSYVFLDGLGRTIQRRDPAEDPTKQIVRDVVGFDTRGFVGFEWFPYPEATSTTYVAPNPALPRMAYTYDPIGRVKNSVEPNSATTTALYDDWTTTVTDAEAHVVSYAHDAYGRLAKVEESNGTAIYTTTYGYDVLDNLTAVTDAAGHPTTLTYDSLSRKLSHTDPDMGTWLYEYDTVDNLVQQTDAREVITTLTYGDALKRLTQVSYAVPPGSGIPNPGAITYTYDDPGQLYSKGRLTGLADSSASSSLEYDNLGRVIKETNVQDSVPYVFEGGFDLLDRLTSLKYPDGEIVSYTYNAQGGLDAVASASTTYVQSIDYNDYAQNIADVPKTVALGNGVTTSYAYDPETLRVEQVTTGSGTLQQLSYSYDLVGNIKSIDDTVAGQNQLFAYDALDRLTQASGGYGSISFGYDAIGNLTAKGSTTLTYGNAPGGSQPHAVTASSDGWIYVYDPNGNMVSKSSSLVTPAAGQLTAKRFNFDADGRLARVDAPTAESATVELQPGWNFFSLPVVPEDLAVSAVFPNIGSDITQITRYNPGTDQFEHHVGNTQFDQFTELEYGRGYEVYCANPNGVSLLLTGASPTLVPGVSLASGWRLIGSTALTIQPVSWLLNGLVSGTDYDAVHRYDSATNSVVSASQAEPAEGYFLHALQTTTWSPPLPRDVSTNYSYDGEGERIKKTTGSSSTTYVGDAYELTGGVATKHIFAGGRRVASKTAGGQTLFYHPDHLGSTNVVTGAAGAQVQRLAYEPFGKVFSNTGSVDVAPKFTDQRFDSETDLYFYNARYYDADIGRFVSADPIVQDPTDPQFLNRFTYVRNNPIRFVDPSGLQSNEGGGGDDESGGDGCFLCDVGAAIAAWFLGRDREEESHTPPGPIQSTPHTPLRPLPGVNFAQARQGVQTLGEFAGDVNPNIRLLQEGATLLRVGPTQEQMLALKAIQDATTVQIGLQLGLGAAVTGAHGRIGVGARIGNQGEFNSKTGTDVAQILEISFPRIELGRTAMGFSAKYTRTTVRRGQAVLEPEGEWDLVFGLKRKGQGLEQKASVGIHEPLKLGFEVNPLVAHGGISIDLNSLVDDLRK